jgi:hypothetical protein
MPIVDRGGSRELADQRAGLLYLIVSRTSAVRRGGLSTSTEQTHDTMLCTDIAGGAFLTS